MACCHHLWSLSSQVIPQAVETFHQQTGKGDFHIKLLSPRQWKHMPGVTLHHFALNLSPRNGNNIHWKTLEFCFAWARCHQWAGAWQVLVFIPAISTQGFSFPRMLAYTFCHGKNHFSISLHSVDFLVFLVKIPGKANRRLLPTFAWERDTIWRKVSWLLSGPRWVPGILNGTLGFPPPSLAAYNIWRADSASVLVWSSTVICCWWSRILEATPTAAKIRGSK